MLQSLSLLKPKLCPIAYVTVMSTANRRMLAANDVIMGCSLAVWLARVPQCTVQAYVMK